MEELLREAKQQPKVKAKQQCGEGKKRKG